MKEWFKKDAKQIVDMLFDTKCFKEDISRDDMIELEKFINYLLESKTDSYIKFIEINKKINEKT